MPEELGQQETHEVDKTVAKQGEVQFLSKEAFKNPAPKYLKIATQSIKKFSIYVTGVLAVTTIFTGNQTKVIVFIVTLVYGLCDALEYSTGVVSTDQKDRTDETK